MRTTLGAVVALALSSSAALAQAPGGYYNNGPGYGGPPPGYSAGGNGGGDSGYQARIYSGNGSESRNGGGHAPVAYTQSNDIKTRTDHLSGTPLVLVLSYIPAEITSITCEGWTMLGSNSWKHQNDFTIPPGPVVAILDANGFNGYCKSAGSIVAHTDVGDFVGVLDRGPGNWSGSTKLTFLNNR